VHIWGSFTLGVSDASPLDLANAYATLGADGIYCSPLPVQSIKDADGHDVASANPDCHRAISADVARAGTDAARCPVGQQSAYGRCDGGTAGPVGGMFGNRPIAGKTGSSEGNATETFVGFTPQIAAAATAANPDSPQDAVGEGVSSSVNGAVAKTMLDALKGKPVVKFPPPSQGIAG
jgi:membrane peptidoglycan carboxypeptidase